MPIPMKRNPVFERSVFTIKEQNCELYSPITDTVNFTQALVASWGMGHGFYTVIRQHSIYLKTKIYLSWKEIQTL
jgi:hypothetical protein